MTSPNMTVRIQWNTLPLALWQEKFARVSRASLLQSYEYAKGVASSRGVRPRWGIIEIDGQEAGMMQVMESALFKNALHGWMLDQGPLWFEGYGSADHFDAVLQALRAEWPRRIGRRARIIPNIPARRGYEALLKSHGFKPGRGNAAYETIWIDLTQSEEDLRASLKKNWRGSLQKAERSGLVFETDRAGQHLGWFLGGYAVDKELKSYKGPSSKLLRNLAVSFAPAGGLHIGRAIKNGEALAGVLIFRHGSSATYQAGWTTPEGRDLCAHHGLLFRAMLDLKASGVRDFDLGGINAYDSQGLRDFKTGMGGDLVAAPGLYIDA